MKVSIVIVSYNSEDFIDKCVKSVLKFLPEEAELIVFDNNSQDKTVENLIKFGDKIKLLESTENLGFGKGNNQAVKDASGEFLFFLNPDTEMTEPILEKLIDYYEKKNNIGIIAPKILLFNGQTQESVRKLPSVMGAIKEFVLGIKKSYGQYVPEGDEPLEVESVYGAAMLIKKELFNKIGGFDEKFFLYYEDADLCRRIKKLGKKIIYYPKVTIKHMVGGTKSKLDKMVLNSQSARIYHGFFGSLMLQLIFMIPRLRRRLVSR